MCVCVRDVYSITGPPTLSPWLSPGVLHAQHDVASADEARKLNDENNMQSRLLGEMHKVGHDSYVYVYTRTCIYAITRIDLHVHLHVFNNALHKDFQ